MELPPFQPVSCPVPRCRGGSPRIDCRGREAGSTARPRSPTYTKKLKALATQPLATREQEFAEGRVGATLDVVVDREEVDDDGQHILIGRTRGEAPDVDPVVFLHLPEDSAVPPARVGEIRTCKVSGSFLYELEAVPVA